MCVCVCVYARVGKHELGPYETIVFIVDYTALDASVNRVEKHIACNVE